jgi:hypothetical protein
VQNTFLGGAVPTEIVVRVLEWAWQFALFFKATLSPENPGVPATGLRVIASLKLQITEAPDAVSEILSLQYLLKSDSSMNDSVYELKNLLFRIVNSASKTNSALRKHVLSFLETECFLR